MSEDARLSGSSQRHLTKARMWVAHQAILLRVASLSAVARHFNRTEAALRHGVKRRFNPDSRFASRSGEFRAARAFEEGDRRHSILFTLRARDQQRRYGGEQLIDAGPIQLGVGRAIAEPSFAFGGQSRDAVKQQTAGVGYELRWKDRGEMSFGLQKTSYSKSIETPVGSLPSSDADLLLKTATATIHATSRLAVSGGGSLMNPWSVSDPARAAHCARARFRIAGR